MPTRLIHESLCVSESIARCSPRAQDAFPRMVLYADNFGVFQVNYAAMKGRLWPLRKDVSPKDIEKWVEEYEREGMVSRFERNGKRYAYFVSWAKFQRIRTDLKRRFPEPPVRNSGEPPKSAETRGDFRVSGAVAVAVAGADTKAVAVPQTTPPLSPRIRGDVASLSETLKDHPTLKQIHPKK